MLYCKNCKVRLSGQYTRCPLCQGDLTGKADRGENAFPAVPIDAKVPHALLTWLALGSVAAIAVCVAVNLIHPSGGWWFLSVAGGVLSFWVSLALVLRKKANIPGTILWQVGVLSLLAFLWDLSAGFQGWSLDYVFPILCTSAMVAMTVIAKVRKLEIQDYIFYLAIDCVFGVLSLILLAAGRIRSTIPSAVCFVSALVFLAALLLFQGKALLAELQRRFHF